MCAFGTFDIIHPGHLAYLRYAALHGDTVIVVVTPDSAVVRRKERVPLFRHEDRMTLVSSLKSVKKCVLGDEDDSWSVLESIKPDVICFGYDQKKAVGSLKKSLSRLGIGSPKIIIAPAYKPKNYHSRHIKLKVRN